MLRWQAAPSTDFYSRPHGRGDFVAVRDDPMSLISTRAPTGGATAQALYLSRSPGISTRAPTGGATLDTDPPMRRASYFYSRPHVRGDLSLIILSIDDILFLLAPPREGRPAANAKSRYSSGFLLAPPREGRPSAALGFLLRVNFYSRPHVRGDRIGTTWYIIHKVFLLAPPREGRPTRTSTDKG